MAEKRGLKKTCSWHYTGGGKRNCASSSVSYKSIRKTRIVKPPKYKEERSSIMKREKQVSQVLLFEREGSLRKNTNSVELYISALMVGEGGGCPRKRELIFGWGKRRMGGEPPDKT